MTERPILFSAPMVKAILAGTKSQTRRVVKPQPAYPEAYEGLRVEYEGPKACFYNPGAVLPANFWLCQYGGAATKSWPASRLWVRETFGIRSDLGKHVEYRASHQEPADFPFSHIYDEKTRWRPSIFMPRWASRITLEITDVRVQRVQEISQADAIAEGFGPETCGPLEWYRGLWDQINGKKYPWSSDPWIWAISFKRTGEVR